MPPMPAGHFQSLTLGRASGSMAGISPWLRIGPGDCPDRNVNAGQRRGPITEQATNGPANKRTYETNQGLPRPHP
jgi:hypothetical protein